MKVPWLHKIGRHYWLNWNQKHLGSEHFSQKCKYCSNVRYANVYDEKIIIVSEDEYDSPDDGSYPNTFALPSWGS